MKYCYVLGLAFLAMTFGACEEGDDPTPAESSGGNGGDEGVGSAGTGGTGACPSDGTGSLDVEVTGLPSGVDASVDVVRGSERLSLTESETLEDKTTGTYVVTAKRVTDADSIVRTVFDPVVTGGSFCLEADGSQTVSVHYTAIPSSNRLWTSNLVGFSSAKLAESGSETPSVTGDAPIGKDVAFDRNGNLWSLGATLAEAMVVRIPASNLASSGSNDFDRELNVPEIECLPALKSMAFDAGGNLWLGACGGTILEIPAASLGRSGDVSSDTVISDLYDAADLAFDAAGNLWVATGAEILRYDADRLGASTSDEADLTLIARDADDSRDLGATGLAFDAGGNLWGFDFGSNFIFQLAAGDLDATGEGPVVSKVSFVLGVLSLLDRGAFDEGGGLWVSSAVDGIARLAPDQLTESAGSGAPVTPERLVTSTALDSGLRIALFPAPQALPLYHTAFAR